MSLIVTTFGDGTPIASVRPVKRRSPSPCAPQIVRGCRAHAWPAARRGAIVLVLLAASLDAGAVDLNLRTPPPTAAAAAAERTMVLAADRHTVARAKLVMDSRDAAAKCRKLATDSRMHCERAAQDLVAGGVAPDLPRPVSAATPPAPTRAAAAKPRYAVVTQ